ncbi:MurR/RpiR family transcriptional regulator [Rothia sp. AR01]|uniref:MurR/RpiR family transcriptional regulator n=1 Tax=Rothia santali TaxID=2949643 RepID=A0A9X2HJ49_9MICC|nr:MurR/RpiR family transcriptional regulator [Rothia santali]MCP3425203.1 MurR/RpiR family transcriptional regulator [Rothia santali]
MTQKGRLVLGAVRAHPRVTAFSSSREVAQLSGVNIGTVTRAAQSLGYSGWADLQQEFRAKYLASLSASEVAAEHELQETSPQSSLTQDRATLSWIDNPKTTENISRIAEMIARSNRTAVVAQGSYASVGIALSHNCSIAGYDVSLLTDQAQMANFIPKLSENDLVIAINSWRLYSSTHTTLEIAHEKGVPSVLMTDSASSDIQGLASIFLSIPSESAGFFPSMVGSISVAQAIVVDLVGIDPQRSQQSIRASEYGWGKFGLMRE